MEKIKSTENLMIQVYQEDIDKTMTDDIWVERFLEWYNGSVNKTIDGIIFSMKFQKRYKVRELKDSDFPSELYSQGIFFEYEPDLLGRNTMYVRSKYNPSCKETREMHIQLLMYLLFKLSEDSQRGKGHTIIVDYSGVSVSNLDLILLKQGLDIPHVFPNCIPLVVAVNIPLFGRILLRTLRKAFSEEHQKLLQVISHEELPQFVDPENIPDFLGGTSKRPYSGPDHVPQGCLSLKEMFEEFVQTEDGEVVPNKSALMFSALDVKTANRVVDYFHKFLDIKT